MLAEDTDATHGRWVAGLSNSVMKGAACRIEGLIHSMADWAAGVSRLVGSQKVVGWLVVFLWLAALDLGSSRGGRGARTPAGLLNGHWL